MKSTVPSWFAWKSTSPSSLPSGQRTAVLTVSLGANPVPRLDLAPEVADVGVDHRGRGHVLGSPARVDQLVAGKRAAGLAGELPEERELGRRERDGPARQRHLPRRVIDDQRAGPDPLL